MQEQNTRPRQLENAPSQMYNFFPQCLGLPTRHHIVLYHHLRVHLDRQQLSSLIVLDPKETDAYMWVSRDMARTAAGRSLPAKTSLAVYELGNGNVKKPISLLLTDLPESGSDVERISTGTKFALKHWIKTRA
jgi:hypothetical protein